MRQPGYLAAVCSDQGTVRSRNEDNFYLGGYCLDQNAALRRARVEQPLGECAAVAVFDGMGGERRGDEASRLAADCLADWAEHLAAGGDPGEYVEAANADICAAARRAGGTMGSTLVLAVLGQTGCTVYNVGDSRAFLWREGTLRQLSRDHTVVAQLLSMGLITPEQARTDRRRHQLSQHLGIPPEEMRIQASAQSFALEPEDTLLLCSDGVTDGVEPEHLARLLASPLPPGELAEAIVDAALEGGSRDNITAMVVRRERPGRTWERFWLPAVACSFALGVLSGLIYLLLR